MIVADIPNYYYKPFGYRYITCASRRCVILSRTRVLMPSLAMMRMRIYLPINSPLDLIWDTHHQD